MHFAVGNKVFEMVRAEVCDILCILVLLLECGIVIGKRTHSHVLVVGTIVRLVLRGILSWNYNRTEGILGEKGRPIVLLSLEG